MQAGVRLRHSSFGHSFDIQHSDFVINLMIHELRLAFRSLAKTPGFTLVAVITVALAIAANTAVFSLVNALLIRPLPFKAPQDLVLLFEKFAGQGLDQIPVSAPEYLDWEKQTRSYERIAAFNFADFNLTGGDMPERIQGAVATPSLFPLLGVPPIKGRVFNDNEFGEGNDGVVVISERLWRRRFNSDPQLVGTRNHAGESRVPAAAVRRAGWHIRRASRYVEADRVHEK
jgi:putative ABC transport system permease protein